MVKITDGGRCGEQRRLKLRNHFHSKIFHEGISISGWSERMKFAVPVPSARTRKYGGGKPFLPILIAQETVWHRIVRSPSVRMVTSGSPEGQARCHGGQRSECKQAGQQQAIECTHDNLVPLFSLVRYSALLTCRKG